MKTSLQTCLLVVVGTLIASVSGLSHSSTLTRINHSRKLQRHHTTESCAQMHRFHSVSTSRNMCTDVDDDMEEKLLDNQMIFSLSNLGDQAFDFSSQRFLTYESLLVWESKVDALAAELNALTNKQILLAVYASILKKAAIKELDPMQIATFQLFSNAIMDALVKLHNPMEAITDLIDEVTDVHLDFVDKFQPMIDDGGDDG